jgi:hypothetical protein
MEVGFQPTQPEGVALSLSKWLPRAEAVIEFIEIEDFSPPILKKSGRGFGVGDRGG